jgi:NAD(P)-dependent dehydrogenase (short-subunit alcohol dehydrogenase family)
MEKNFNFKNKTIFLTGANGFLGIEIKNAFLKLGASLILTDKQKKVNHQLKKKQNVIYFKCDLTNLSETNNLIKNVKNKIKKIDVIINNASFTGDSNLKGWSTKFTSQNVSNWDNTFDVSLKSNFEICKNFQQLLSKKDGGSIINIASIYGFMGPDWNLYENTSISNPAGYGISKAGLVYLTKWLASTMSPKVRVNCISPGGIKRSQDKNFIKKYIKKVPLKRMCKEKDIIGAVLFLSSSYSEYITGQNIVIDGGYSII